MTATITVRMPPAPTGLFHVGSARTALYNWLFARHHGGRFVLRIEDTDQERSRPEFVESILDAHRWLGLEWDEGPHFQSQRLDAYIEYARQLQSQGLAYHCYCTPEELARRREELQAVGQTMKHDPCRTLSAQERAAFEAAGRPAALRFVTPDDGSTAFDDVIRGRVEFENALVDDFVIMKANGFPTYLLANMADDHDQGVTHVIRGEDLISGTPRQIMLYQALGKSLPVFAHLPLLLGPDRSKLSKRHGALPLVAYREQGYLPEAMTNFLALLGWSPGGDRELMTRDELVALFSLEAVGKSGAVFDIEKLLWMNGQYIRETPLPRLAEAARPFVAPITGDADDAFVRQALSLVKERVKTLSELPDAMSYFFTDAYETDAKAASKWLTDESRFLLAALADRLQSLPDFSHQSVEASLRALAEERGVKPAQIIHPTRVALSGRTAGPGLFEMMSVLGKERVLARLRRVAAPAH